MRALFTTQPGLGHFQPMAPLARALREAGHEVAFACSGSFAPTVEAAGLTALPVGIDWLESRSEAHFPRFSDEVAGDRGFWMLTELFAGEAALRTLPDLLAACASWRPDVVVRNDFEFAGPVAAERCGLPHATVGIGLYLPPVTWRPLIGRQWAELRAAAGLAPDPQLARLCPHLYLASMPASYQFPATPLPASFHALRFEVLDRSETTPAPPWLDRLPDRPTVLATLGTVFNRTPRAAAVFRTLVEALADAPVNLVLTVGEGRSADGLGALPENVRVEPYVPHSHLLPRCAAAITQGGSSTTKAALARGLPVLVVPLYGEDVFHAMRCAALGVGLVVREPGRFEPYLYDRTFGELSPACVREAVHRLLARPGYRAAAGDLARAMASLPGPERGVALLEALVAG